VEQEAKGVTVGELVLAVRLVSKLGAETPYIQASTGSPMVLSALAGWLESATRGLVERRWWRGLGLAETTVALDNKEAGGGG